ARLSRGAACDIGADKTADEAAVVASDRAARIGLVDAADVEADKAARNHVRATIHVAGRIGERDRSEIGAAEAAEQARVAAGHVAAGKRDRAGALRGDGALVDSDEAAGRARGADRHIAGR